MEVSVLYKEKKYSYIQLGEMMTWVDDEQTVVPLMLHSVLREKAISSGINSSIFLSDIPVLEKNKEKKIKEKKVVKSSKNAKKKNLLSGFNPFQK